LEAPEQAEFELFEALSDPSVLVRGQAARSLAQIGAIAVKNYERLVKEFATQEVESARHCLGRIIARRPPPPDVSVGRAVETLTSLLDHPDIATRDFAICGLAHCGSRARSAFNSAREAFLSGKVDEHKGLYAIGRIDPDMATQELISALQSSNSDLHMVAAYALGNVKGATAAVFGALELHLAASRPEIRFVAAEALLKLNPGHPASRNTIENLLLSSTLVNPELIRRARRVINSTPLNEK
jgi:HEAT repeat protein